MEEVDLAERGPDKKGITHPAVGLAGAKKRKLHAGSTCLIMVIGRVEASSGG
ncbi:hypothetical protein BQ8794_70136 [Mesorhizobium prunaredense]|uniref:Uncharacterized protein n=1 Tax=Mesorhizobium prunaredense TaxID=1631249 RepID=A0A1R3VGZ3_9HYPH|nr:hypothetical protein BQ8794_70136 [Mesorhizobium prunaredense]